MFIKDAYNSANIKLIDVDEYYQIDCDLLEDLISSSRVEGDSIDEISPILKVVFLIYRSTILS